MSSVAEIERLSKASCALTKAEQRSIDRTCEIGKDVLRQGCLDLVIEAKGAPLLTSKRCDGTPLSVVLRAKKTLPSGASVRRSGRQSAEYLVKNQFVRAHLPGGRAATRVLLQEPQQLTHGKKADAIYSACLHESPAIRRANSYANSCANSAARSARIFSKRGVRAPRCGKIRALHRGFFLYLLFESFAGLRAQKFAPQTY